jgi:hypothetical protein
MKHWQGLTVAAEGTGMSTPLSQQVNMFGELLGHAVREVVGAASFERVERLRTLCKAAYHNGNPAPPPFEMGSAHLPIARFYSLARGGDFHERIADDFQRATQAICAITGRAEILDNAPVLKKSIALRNPYTDVLNLREHGGRAAHFQSIRLACRVRRSAVCREQLCTTAARARAPEGRHCCDVEDRYACAICFTSILSICAHSASCRLEICSRIRSYPQCFGKLSKT